MTVSVIVPCYNEERNIGKCLDTLLNQSLRNYEIIIIDDGSSDRTKEIVKRYNVKLLEQDHKGPGTARNWAAKEARGDILVFVDADMYFDRKYLENLIVPINEGNAIGTFHKEEYIGNKENVWAVCWNLEITGDLERRIMADHPDDAIIYRAVLRKIFLDVGGFDISVGYEDDATLYPKLGIKAHYARGAVCYHNNPGTLHDIYKSARWVGRSTRFSKKPERIIKYLLPFSVFSAIIKTFKYGILQFFIFKIVYDTGLQVGFFSRFIFKKHSK